jgi:hypothetical protein
MEIHYCKSFYFFKNYFFNYLILIHIHLLYMLLKVFFNIHIKNLVIIAIIRVKFANHFIAFMDIIDAIYMFLLEDIIKNTKHHYFDIILNITKSH